MTSTPLFLFNSMGRKLEEFAPLEPGKVRLYSCGPTVYNYAHIGNLRAYLFVDTLRRVLQWRGDDVLHVMNITDIGHLTSDADEGEDKMELAAARRGKSVWEIAAYYTEEFKRDIERLNILPPSVWCKATDHIQEMIAFAKICEERGFTYPLADGLYFDTSKVKDYGLLALLDLQGQKQGLRVDIKEGKHNPSDFALWRFSPKDKKRLMEWHSPWGLGAPGWHLECSVMSLKYLGRHFDIHTGGIDHRQIHHCNEIAQNQAYLGGDQSGVRFWLHNEFLVLGGEKMSKSADEFLRLQALIDRGVHPLVYRYFVLMASYRSPLAFSREALLAARMGLQRLLHRVQSIKEKAPASEAVVLTEEAKYGRGAPANYILSALARDLSRDALLWIEKLNEAIGRDLNTAEAIALLSQLVDAGLEAEVQLRLIAAYDLVLGLNLLRTEPAELNLRPSAAGISEADIERLIAERLEARRRKDFARADEIRNELGKNGIALHDSPDGTSWEWTPQEREDG
jgi:cysteinyl-tRNA synthetase